MRVTNLRAAVTGVVAATVLLALLPAASAATSSADQARDQSNGQSNSQSKDQSGLDPSLVRADPATGTARSVFASGRHLTSPSDEPLEDIVLGYVREHRTAFGLSKDQLADLVVTKSYRTTHNGAGHVTLGQRVDGRRVHGRSLTATLDAEGRLVQIGGSLATGKPVGEVRLSAADALDRAAAASGATPRKSPARADNRAEGRQRFANVYARGIADPRPVTAELVWFAADHGRRLRAAWYTDMEVAPSRWYETVVDAADGSVLARENRYKHSGPEGTVFREQHPDATGASRQVTPFTGIDGSWVSARVTSGNNVNAYRDLADDDSVGYRPQTPPSGDPNFQHFNYPFTDDWRQDADGDQESLDADLDAAITQLFYYTNVMHDRLYELGFDEASGNFQVDNFGRGGAGGDPVLAEAQDGWDFGCEDDDDNPVRCRNNANFATPDDGSSPRMQMFMWSPPRPYRDGSLDGDVIAHEYGHGVSHRLVGGGDLGSGPQTGALGEGWSDTISFLTWGDAVIGEYVTGNPTSGIRTTAYDVSTEGYGSFDSTRGVHRNGEVWAATVYDIREAKGLAFTRQLVVDGMKNTSSSPSYLDSRDGILAADMTTTGGANQCLLWGVFAGRGMGVSATSSADQETVTAASDVPPECRAVADAGGPYTTEEGTDVTLDASGSTGVSFEWDFDGDGQYDDATSLTPVFDRVGQDGVFTVGLRVTGGAGGTDTDTTTVTVTNVAPTLEWSHDGPEPEGGTVTVSGTVTDPGWLDPLSASVDWGEGTTEPVDGTLENERPDATLTFTATHVYGDNGTFSITVCASDDDTSTCEDATVTVTNVDPVAAIDKSDAVDAAGGPTIVADKGDEVPLRGRVTDPGSDDLTITWDYGDGPPSPDRSTTSLVNPPDPDPPMSPSVQPRDVTDETSVTYRKACLYEVGFAARDDDGGAGSDGVTVVVQGHGLLPATATTWYVAYLVGSLPPDHLPDETLQCYLDIVGHMSAVFSEDRDASTIAKARRVLAIELFDQKEKLDRQLLAAWLNFAHGPFDLDERVDTNCDLKADGTFFDVVERAEQVRLNPSSTRRALREQTRILTHLNLCNPI